jgi:dipeptidyl aminopeptidase/acylaminoacyl peptidase
MSTHGGGSGAAAEGPGAGGPAAGGSAAGSPRAGGAAASPVTPEDLGLFSDITGVQVSADGTLVAAVVSRPDIAANRYERGVVAGPADGSAPFRRLTTADGTAETQPAWAPSGHDLATARQDGSGWSIWVHSVGRGTAAPVLESWPDPIEELAWSPAGDRLLFVVREPADREYWQTPADRRPPLRLTTLRYREDGTGWTAGRPRQGYVVSTAPGAPPRKISTGGHDDSGFGWHPDGRRVVFVSQREPGLDGTVINDVYLQDADGESPAVRLTATTLECAQPRVSPDGATVAFIAMDVAGFPSVTEVATVPVAGGAVTIASAGLDRDCGTLSWDDDGTLTALAEDAGAAHAYRLDPGAARPPERVVAGARRVTSLAARAGTLAYVTSGPVDPPRLVVATGDGGEREIHAPNAAIASARDLRGPEHRVVRAADGTAIDSWLTLPDAGVWRAPFPLLLCLQGGGTQYGYLWSHEFQVLAAAGFATLQVNPRGSAGYGNAWQRAVCGPDAATPGTGWGSVDIDDVAAVVRATLASVDSLDARRVGVQGGSYGGLVTTWLLGSTDLFAAGWAERGPYNLVSLAGTNDESPWFFETYLGRSVVEDPAAYWASSALRLAGGITAPLAIVHSEEDRRCPIQQAEELFMALKLLGRTVEFIRFPGEGHGLTRTGSPVHRLQRLALMLEWFYRWLRPEASR